MAVSWVVFAAATLALYTWQPGLWGSLAVTLSAAIAGARLLPHTPPAAGPSAPPRVDLIVRVLASGTLVLVLTALADRVGPALSGLFTAFPILTTTMAGFMQAQRGAAAVVQFFRGFLPAIVGFAVFCLVFAVGVPRLGIALGTAAALGVQLVVHGLVLRPRLSSG